MLKFPFIKKKLINFLTKTSEKIIPVLSDVLYKVRSILQELDAFFIHQLIIISIITAMENRKTRILYPNCKFSNNDSPLLIMLRVNIPHIFGALTNVNWQQI